MEQLVTFVSEKTGLSNEISRQAVEAVVEYLKTNLPDPVAGMMEQFLSGEKSGGLEDVAKEMLGGFKFP